ncbi:MAG: hypothetical protein CVU39_07715 [Chloroflexi bacterium HGW-Chloroflexi-10]|nr:MAG: hypothetical protein CVU39_07715 [Chloroflexi bacterium HGW-Chloroflexi-10]
MINNNDVKMIAPILFQPQELNPREDDHRQREDEVQSLRIDILKHFQSLGLPANLEESTSTVSKEAIRTSHRLQKLEIFQHEREALAPYWEHLLTYFANGSEVQPNLINPELIPVISGDETGYLFRMAALLWSVPVSKGYGRRMRYLVLDHSNGKLIGIFALGDPVFNLNARDSWIGWNVNDRKERLVHMMDAYVVGAVPPYSQILGGKLVASLIGSEEISRDFTNKYSQSEGIISKQHKTARLALVTVTSALGRSSLYNRLKLTSVDEHNEKQPLVELLKIGSTRGYGHFHLSNSLFDRLRELLVEAKHPYASGHKYGEGPNWRWRVIRVGLKEIGLDEDLIRHGIIREVYAMPMATNFREFLCGETSDINLHRPTAIEISKTALDRWVLPRALREPEYRTFRRSTIEELMHQE